MFVCEKNFSCCDYQYWDRWEDVEQEAKECGHLIEAEPVKRGRNLQTENLSLFECSKCHWSDWDTYTGDTPTYNYCPHCGAKMMEDEDG